MRVGAAALETMHVVTSLRQINVGVIAWVGFDWFCQMINRRTYKSSLNNNYAIKKLKLSFI
jgi:hypothetical protein